MGDTLNKIYWQLEQLIVPGLRSSQHVYAETISECVVPSTRWLDIGCGHQLFEPWIPGQHALAARAAFTVGIDPDVPSLQKNDVIPLKVAGLTLPFADGAFTLVTANMVVEHLEDPVAVFQDIRRILRPGGRCVIHTPNVYHWHVWMSTLLPQSLKHVLIRLAEGRAEDDVYPTHYQANTPRALACAAEAAGLRVDRLRLLDTSTTSRIYLGPFVLLDLLLLRLQRLDRLASLRSNMIAVFSVPSSDASDGAQAGSGNRTTGVGNA